MARGGKRSGAGRPKGSRNVKTLEQVEAIVSEGITPLDYMLQILRDETQEQSARLDAANKAAPYVHAKLASVDLSSKDGTMTPAPAQIDASKMTDGALLEVLNALKRD